MEASGQGLLLGAYAAYATLTPWTRELAQNFWRELRRLPRIRGLELPFYPDTQVPVSELLPELDPSWDFILTTLPGTMQSLAKMPHYGLASAAEEGRQAALAAAEAARLWLGEVQRYCRRASVLAVHLHSAPRPTTDVRASPKALRRSLEELLAKDWFGAKICLEHCDAWQAERPPAKGFLSLAAELEIAAELGCGITLNWGRSALETQSASGVLAHIDAARESGRLFAFMFSGTAVDDPLYGNWQDNHAPVQLADAQPWRASRGLLTPEEIERVAARLKSHLGLHWGLKIQPFPSSLGLAQRIACLDEQIGAVATILGC